MYSWNLLFTIKKYEGTFKMSDDRAYSFSMASKCQNSWKMDERLSTPFHREFNSYALGMKKYVSLLLVEIVFC